MNLSDFVKNGSEKEDVSLSSNPQNKTRKKTVAELEKRRSDWCAQHADTSPSAKPFLVNGIHDCDEEELRVWRKI